MEDKYMVNDVLEGIKGDLTTLQGAINETENVSLRQTLQQMRNGSEAFQYELFKRAQTKGFYAPAEKANQTEIKNVKTQLEQ